MAKLLLDPRDRAIFKPTAAPICAVGDIVLVEAGDIIPSDGEVIEGVASVNESAVTGESAPVVREAGGDRSAVTGGTQVVSDWLVVRITADAGLHLPRPHDRAGGRRRTPQDAQRDRAEHPARRADLIFLIAVVTLVGFGSYSGTKFSIPVLAALLVCLIPTTIGGLLSAIGIAGMDRLVRFNVVATSGRAVEAAGDVDALLLDKTGTITFGNRMASGFYPVAGVAERDLAEACALASLGDDTPEGRSILALARDRYSIVPRKPEGATIIPFSANTRMSGVDLAGKSYRKGAVDSVLKALGTEDDAVHRGCGPHRPRRLHPAGRGCQWPAAGADRAEGHRQAWHQGAVLRTARHGHPHRHGHRR